MIMIGTLSSCKQITPVDTPFAIYNKNDDIVLKLGDKRSELEPLLGPDERSIMESEEEKIERVEYWDNEGLFLDYNADGDVIALRFKNKDWQLEDGLGIGKKVSDIKAKYPEEFIHKFEETEDLWISYDDNGNITKFSLDSHYLLRFRIDAGFVDMIVVQDNTAYAPISQ